MFPTRWSNRPFPVQLSWWKPGAVLTRRNVMSPRRQVVPKALLDFARAVVRARFGALVLKARAVCADKSQHQKDWVSFSTEDVCPYGGRTGDSRAIHGVGGGRAGKAHAVGNRSQRRVAECHLLAR